MTHTECKDCKLSNGDCGNHFKMDGTTNYDIASLSSCDQYGNCMFFKSKVKPDTLISREALKKALNEIFDTMEVVLFDDIIAIIENAPTVKPEITNDDLKEGYHIGYELAESKFNRLTGEWLTIGEE